MAGVLVTRAAEDGARTAERLRALGHRPVPAPVIEIRPTGVEPPAGSFAAVLATSVHAAPGAARLPRDLPILAVGARTAAAFADLGFRHVSTAQGDAAALVDLVKERIRLPARLLYLAGVDRKTLLKNALASLGYQILICATYEARPVTEWPASAVSAMAAGDVEAVLHFSRRSAELAVNLAGQAGLGPVFAGLRHCCLSDDVAEALRARIPEATLAVAVAPTEDALLALVPP